MERVRCDSAGHFTPPPSPSSSAGFEFNASDNISARFFVLFILWRLLRFGALVFGKDLSRRVVVPDMRASLRKGTSLLSLSSHGLRLFCMSPP